MLSELLTLLLLCKICLYYSYELTITNWSQNRDLENVRQTTNIGLLTTPSAIACSVECANILPCISCSYHIGNKTCLLYSIPFTVETTGAVNEDGWQTYNPIFGNCPTALGYFYKRNLNMCYHLQTDEANVSEALLFCAVGGLMLRINTVEKQAHIAEFLNSRPLYSVYIGGLSEHLDDLFSYEDGSPLNLFFWMSGNPRNFRSIRLRKNTLEWINSNGVDARPFLCEITL